MVIFRIVTFHYFALMKFCSLQFGLILMSHIDESYISLSLKRNSFGPERLNIASEALLTPRNHSARAKGGRMSHLK